MLIERVTVILSQFSKPTGLLLLSSLLNTMEEKDRKRAEIDQLLNENIKPEIERLRKEKKNYMEYTNKQREIEEKNRFIVAYDYHKAQVNQNNNQKRMKKPLLKGFVVFSMCLMLDLKANFGYKHQFVFFKKKKTRKPSSLPLLISRRSSKKESN